MYCCMLTEFAYQMTTKSGHVGQSCPIRQFAVCELDETRTFCDHRSKTCVAYARLGKQQTWSVQDFAHCGADYCCVITG